MRLGDLGEQVPARGETIEGIQDQVAASGIEEALPVAAVGIGDDGAIAAVERAAQELADGGAFPRPGRADDLEVFGLIRGGNRLSGEGERPGAFSAVRPDPSALKDCPALDGVSWGSARED